MREGELIWWHRANGTGTKKVPGFFIRPIPGKDKVLICAPLFDWQEPEVRRVSPENVEPRKEEVCQPTT